MRGKIIFISIIIAFLLITGCSRIFKSITEDENAVYETNPKFVPTEYSYTYKISFDKYDILTDTCIVTKAEGEKSDWDTIPTKKIIDTILKSHSGNDKPIIKFWTNRDITVNDLMNSYTTHECIGFDLYDSAGGATQYCYESGTLYKIYNTLTKDVHPEMPLYQLEEVAKIEPDSKDNMYPFINLKPIEYESFTLYRPSSLEEFPGYPVIRVAESIVKTLAENKAKRWNVILEGIGQIEKESVYEFTLSSGIIGDDSVMLSDPFRVAISEKGNVYRYYLKPVEHSKIDNQISEPPNSSSGFGIGSNKFISKGYKSFHYTYQRPIPAYKTNGKITPELAAYGIYLNILKDINKIKPYKIQEFKRGENTISICLNALSRTESERTIDWRGVDEINGHEALEFSIDNSMLVAVTDDRTIYTYETEIKKEGHLNINENDPKLLKDYIKDLNAKKKKSPELFITLPRGYSYNEESITKFFFDEYDTMPQQKAISYFQELIKDYKGEVDGSPWMVVFIDNDKIDGERVYIVEIGQGPSSDLSLLQKRIKAALSENGKLYIYKDNKPELIRTVKTEKK